MLYTLLSVLTELACHRGAVGDAADMSQALLGIYICHSDVPDFGRFNDWTRYKKITVPRDKDFIDKVFSSIRMVSLTPAVIFDVIEILRFGPFRELIRNVFKAAQKSVAGATDPLPQSVQQYITGRVHLST